MAFMNVVISYTSHKSTRHMLNESNSKMHQEHTFALVSPFFLEYRKFNSLEIAKKLEKISVFYTIFLSQIWSWDKNFCFCIFEKLQNKYNFSENAKNGTSALGLSLEKDFFSHLLVNICEAVKNRTPSSCCCIS
jgi:hypothetical protein